MGALQGADRTPLKDFFAPQRISYKSVIYLAAEEI